MQLQRAAQDLICKLFRNVVVAGSNRYDAEQGKKAVVEEVVVVVEAFEGMGG
jgi:hypothetical protein